MTSSLYNRVLMTTSTTGNGRITLGTALTGYRTFASANVSNNDEVSMIISDGNSWEHSVGTYTSSNTTVTRTLVESSTGALLNLSGGASVFIVPTTASFGECGLGPVCTGNANTYITATLPLSSGGINVGIVPQSSNLLYQAPLNIQSRSTFTKLGIRSISRTTDVSFYLGIYETRSDAPLPGRLITSVGPLTASLSNTNYESSINVTLDSGLYWLAFLANGTGTSFVGQNSTSMLRILGYDSTFTAIRAVTRTFTYGALPSNESSQTYTASTAYGTILPYLRA